jgi:hypothetical protein
MAKSKSPIGGKITTNPSKEQTSASIPANVPDVPANLKADAKAAAQPVAAEKAPVETKPAARIAPELRKKFEVVKTEPRRVVPINLEDEIRRRAYELYQQRGIGSGSEAQDWLTAEHEVRQRYHQQQSA